jgi:hypothetical protein
MPNIALANQILNDRKLKRAHERVQRAEAALKVAKDALAALEAKIATEPLKPMYRLHPVSTVHHLKHVYTDTGETVACPVHGAPTLDMPHDQAVAEHNMQRRCWKCMVQFKEENPAHEVPGPTTKPLPIPAYVLTFAERQAIIDGAKRDGKRITITHGGKFKVIPLRERKLLERHILDKFKAVPGERFSLFEFTEDAHIWYGSHGK